MCICIFTIKIRIHGPESCLPPYVKYHVQTNLEMVLLSSCVNSNMYLDTVTLGAWLLHAVLSANSVYTDGVFCMVYNTVASDLYIHDYVCVAL